MRSSDSQYGFAVLREVRISLYRRNLGHQGATAIGLIQVEKATPRGTFRLTLKNKLASCPGTRSFSSSLVRRLASTEGLHTSRTMGMSQARFRKGRPPSIKCCQAKARLSMKELDVADGETRKEHAADVIGQSTSPKRVRDNRISWLSVSTILLNSTSGNGI